MWHSDIIFRNHYARMVREAAAAGDAAKLARAGSRLLWLPHLDYRLEGYSALRAAAEATDDRAKAAEYGQKFDETLAAMRAPRPQDSAGNVLFPPAR